jgi:hypothetical protein
MDALAFRRGNLVSIASLPPFVIARSEATKQSLTPSVIASLLRSKRLAISFLLTSPLSVIASLNANAFRRGNLVFNTTFSVSAMSEATKQSQKRLPRLSFGKPRNDS